MYAIELFICQIYPIQKRRYNYVPRNCQNILQHSKKSLFQSKNSTTASALWALKISQRKLAVTWWMFASRTAPCAMNMQLVPL